MGRGGEACGVDPVTWCFEVRRHDVVGWRGTARRHVGGEPGLDVGGVKVGLVEQFEGQFEMTAGDCLADFAAQVVQRDAHVFWQEFEVADEEEVVGGEAAHGGARGRDVGGTALAVPVRRVLGDFRELGDQGAQVAVEDVAEEGVGIDKVAADGGHGEVQPDADVDEADAVAPVFGQDGAPQAQDVVPPLAFAIGEEFWQASEGFRLGADDTG